MDADKNYRRTIDKSVNNTGEVISLIRNVIKINEKLADNAIRNSPSDRRRKETMELMEQRLNEQEEKNAQLEAVQRMYLDEIDRLNQNNNAAKDDIVQLKKELKQIAQKYESSNAKMIEELKKVDLLTINQAIEIISLRSLLPKMNNENGKRLLGIIGQEATKNKEVKTAAETIMKVLDSPDVIPTFIGKSRHFSSYRII